VKGSILLDLVYMVGGGIGLPRMGLAEGYRPAQEQTFQNVNLVAGCNLLSLLG